MPSAAPAVLAGLLRHSPWDAVLVGLSGLHAVVLLAAPSVPVIALGLWWNANTVAHNFIHLPFFRSPRLNRWYSRGLTLLLGFPQRLWRDRHLAHHAGVPARLRLTRDLGIELMLVASLWTTLAIGAPGFFLTVYLPGWLLGLALCQAQGHYEHARGTTSHYGRVYNLVFFNDGYHVEHHDKPRTHWTTLPGGARQCATPSRWPPVLRWLEAASLEGLERLVLQSAWLQRRMVALHERAFRGFQPALADVRRVTVVGGGLFPRTAIVLDRVLPGASVTLVDADAAHLDAARPFLRADVRCEHRRHRPGAREDTDLLVVPLAYDGDRQVIYDRPPAPHVLVHDWIWSPRGETRVVSWLLLKRLNLIRECAPPASSSS